MSAQRVERLSFLRPSSSAPAYLPRAPCRSPALLQNRSSVSWFLLFKNPVYFTASQKQASPNGFFLTTFRIPLTIVPAGSASFAAQLPTPLLNFPPVSGFPSVHRRVR